VLFMIPALSLVEQTVQAFWEEDITERIIFSINTGVIRNGGQSAKARQRFPS
jgi:hypothetical protein